MEVGMEDKEVEPGNCRNCKNMDVKTLAQRNKTLAKQGYGFCLKHEGRIPMAGCFCADWVEAQEATVQAREAFWRSR